LNFAKGTVKSSPYVGVFASTTDEICLIPHSILPKEHKQLETELDTKTLKVNLGGTSLLGVLARGIGKKIAITGIAEKQEINILEKEGLEIMVLEDYSSAGNLIAMNKNGGIVSPLIADKNVKKLETFFDIKFHKIGIAGLDVPGSCVTVTNKGFICHPNTSEEEFTKLEKIFKVKGMATTSNYGDLFVSNSVVANTKGVIAGANTSGIELGKIDEGLRGEE